MRAKPITRLAAYSPVLPKIPRHSTSAFDDTGGHHKVVAGQMELPGPVPGEVRWGSSLGAGKAAGSGYWPAGRKAASDIGKQGLLIRRQVKCATARSVRVDGLRRPNWSKADIPCVTRLDQLPARVD